MKKYNYLYIIFFILILSMSFFSCITYTGRLLSQQQLNATKAEQALQMNLEWQTRDEYINSALAEWDKIKDETDVKVFENYLFQYYYGDIYYFLYEPALKKIAESFLKTESKVPFTEQENDYLFRTENLNPEIHFIHNYGLGLNPTVVLDTRNPADEFVQGDIYVFDFLYVNRKSRNSLLVDTAYWAPTEIENQIGVNKTEIYLRDVPTSFKFKDRNWHTILRYIGETRVFTVNKTDDLIESFEVLWFSPVFDEHR